VKTGIKLDSSQVGIIFPSINYENKAGISQAYMITNEIFIDMIDFVRPVSIPQTEFRDLWQRYDWENKINIATNIM
jgi:coatomer subunit beta